MPKCGLLLAIMVIFPFFNLPSMAQSRSPGIEQSATDLSARDPLLRTGPATAMSPIAEDLAELLAMLNRPKRPNIRGYSRPTRAEQRQLGENPDFLLAYGTFPAATLHLLREANKVAHIP